MRERNWCGRIFQIQISKQRLMMMRRNKKNGMEFASHKNIVSDRPRHKNFEIFLSWEFLCYFPLLPFSTFFIHHNEFLYIFHSPLGCPTFPYNDFGISSLAQSINCWKLKSLFLPAENLSQFEISHPLTLTASKLFAFLCTIHSLVTHLTCI